MPEGDDDMLALVPKLLGTLRGKNLLPDGQGEKAQHQGIESRDDEQE
jgi:hypothetical protein